jgi:hypothetical protein
VGQSKLVRLVIIENDLIVVFGLDRYARAFPCHQPEMDLPYVKAVSRSWETTSGAAYCDITLQRNPALRANTDVAQVPSIGLS